MIATCNCPHCNSTVEIDTDDLHGMESGTFECPACHLEIMVLPPDAPDAQQQPVEEPCIVLDSLPTSGEEALYYFRVDTIEKGPYTVAQLRSMWDNGLITADAVCRRDKSSQWIAASSLLKHFSNRRSPQQMAVVSMLLRIFCILSFVAFFLPNASLTVPIFGVVEVSGFDFLLRAPKQNDSSSNPQAADLRPNIQSEFGENGFQFQKASIGAILCVLSALGLIAHYALTLIWGVLTVGFKKSFDTLNAAWLFLAVQFPIVFLIGSKMALGALKASALEAARNGNDNSLGAALGQQVGAALVNNYSIQPGAVMWVLMLVGLTALTLPFFWRSFSIKEIS